MKYSVIQQVNTIAVIATGMFAGGGLMVGVTLGLRWSSLEPAQLVHDFPQDWIYMAWTIIPIALVQTVFLALSVRLAWSRRNVRNLWLMALGLWIVNGVITSVYHVPVVFKAMSGSYTPDVLASTVATWLALHWLRVAIALLTAYIAISAALQDAMFTVKRSHQKEFSQ
ncbi:MAG: hypothetical protein HC838_01240 [Spirulinaceae cyanobacterium RM2_2_10]|nr:hypothetical protein [bacterium]NJO18957.1 hypothetical protein [Spirulinaceae cyanobacterium RM2_2_10]